MLGPKNFLQINTLPHVFGPVALIVIVTTLFTVVIHHIYGVPKHAGRSSQQISIRQDSSELQSAKELFERRLKSYHENLDRFDANLKLQALFVLITVLLIVRRTDSLNVFGNQVPLSWLHLFVPFIIIFLWLGFGFLLDNLIESRIRGVELLKALSPQNSELVEQQKTFFQDAGFIDGMTLAFVDYTDTTYFPGPVGPIISRNNFSGLEVGDFLYTTSSFLVLILGTLLSASHACLLALFPIGCRRYLQRSSRRWLSGYYLFPLLPLAVLLVSHWQYTYGGGNRNWLQPYVAVMTVIMTVLLIWISVLVDRKVAPESIRRMRKRRLYFIPLYSNIGKEDTETSDSSAKISRSIALIGDSLSTNFHVGALGSMLIKMRNGWKKNWFVDVHPQIGNIQSISERLGKIANVSFSHYASPRAKVTNNSNGTLMKFLTDTRHFADQVDELLQNDFPDLLLIWIGHNDLNWRKKLDRADLDSIQVLAKEFSEFYEQQIRRLIDRARSLDKNSAIIIYGLVHFEAFFVAREACEQRRVKDRALYPYWDKAYNYFESMKPEYRQTMIDLALVYNSKLMTMVNELQQTLKGSSVQISYSDAMASADIKSADMLHRADAWHPSCYGHRILAQAAMSAIENYI